MNNLDIDVTNVFERNWDALGEYRNVINQGGSRSSKTYSIIQMILILCLENTGKVYSIVRKTLPSIKASVLRDLEEIITTWDIWDTVDRNKTDNIYKINGNIIEFFSLDNEQKVRGAKRDFLYCNEANELSWKEYQQLTMRTSDTVVIDYNPSDNKHWIYSKLIPREDSILIKSTYKDNPYCPQGAITELLWMEENDPDGWRCYGLGEAGMGSDTIFPKHTVYKRLPEDVVEIGYGLDFGFTNDPSTLVKGYISGRDIYLEELFYTTGLTNPDISREFKICHLTRTDTIYADSAEPKSIKELENMGWDDIRGAIKGPDSIKNGISTMKSFRIFIKGENIEEEFVNYKWKKDKAGDNTNTPIDKWNHIIDASRYLIWMTQSEENNNGDYFVYA